MLGASENMDEFLRGLGMSVVFGPVRPVDLSRVTQLINKTNQFNPTTRRYSAEEMEAIAASPESISLRFRLLDKFGDNGLISVLILRPDAAQPGVMEIDTWVMSCRVFGRELEFEAMNIAVEAARSRGVRSFRASYVPTKKNGVISDLYPRLGFTRADAWAPADGAIQWRLNLCDYVERKTHIERSAE
jgi:FkbH-like protein